MRAKNWYNQIVQFYHRSNLPTWEWYNPPEESTPVAFCLDTSLHGLKYVGQRKRHACERLFWLLTFAVAAVAATRLIWDMWENFTNAPIITVFNTEEKSLDEIPFPSVTICNVNQVKRSMFERIEDDVDWAVRYGGSTSMIYRSLAKYIDISYICENVNSFSETLNQQVKGWIKTHHFVESVFGIVDELDKYFSPEETLWEVSQPCDDMIENCIVMGTVLKCNRLFRAIRTDYGICCTFNTIPENVLMKNLTKFYEHPHVIKTWKNANLDYEDLIFTNETMDRRVPWRQRYPGQSADSNGYIMGLNVPLDFPRMKDNAIAIEVRREVFVGIRPEITLSENSIKSFPDKRKCYYGNEYELPHYTAYTQSNCLNECISRRTYEKCRCVMAHMPHNSSTQICRYNQHQCSIDMQRELVSSGLRALCEECLPTCTQILYQKEATEFMLRKIKRTPRSNRYCYPDRSIVHVYFDKHAVQPRLRKQLMTTTQLIANAGGLLGLCLGFSAISFLEIFYFLTLRLFCRLRREKTVVLVLQNSPTKMISRGDLGPTNQRNHSDTTAKKLAACRKWESNVLFTDLDLGDGQANNRVFTIHN